MTWRLLRRNRASTLESVVGSWETLPEARRRVELLTLDCSRYRYRLTDGSSSYPVPFSLWGGSW
jgi:hypothetical protein